MDDDHKVSFEDAHEPFPMCIDLTDIHGILDKGNTVTQWISDINNGGSIGNWVGKAVEKITGVNPFEWVAQWFSGDWYKFAYCALVWEACAKAVDEMEANLHGGVPTALSCVWEGKAADSAIDYFYKLRQATAVESEFYNRLFEKYKELMEASYYAQQTIVGYFTQLYDTVYVLLDEGYDILKGDLPKGGVADIVIGELVEYILLAVDRMINIYKTYSALQRAHDLPDVPETELQAIDDGYKHPRRYKD